MSTKKNCSGGTQAGRRNASRKAPKPAKIQPSNKGVAVSSSSKQKSRTPDVQTMRDGSAIISHREFIQEVTSTTEYAVDAIELNPGLAETFVWLSDIANNYETYEFMELTFELDTSVSAITPGFWGIGVDSDAADDPPGNIQDFFTMPNESGKLWERIRFKVPKSILMGVASAFKSRYVRSGVVDAVTDIKTYDVGNLYVMTSAGDPAVTIAGNLFVEYKIRLMTPQSDKLGRVASKSARITASTASALLPLGTVTRTVDGGLPVEFNTGGIFILPPGKYQVKYRAGGSIAAGVITPPAFTFPVGSGSVSDNSMISTTNLAIGFFNLTVNDPGTNVQISFAANYPNLNAMTFFDIGQFYIPGVTLSTFEKKAALRLARFKRQAMRRRGVSGCEQALVAAPTKCGEDLDLNKNRTVSSVDGTTVNDDFVHIDGQRFYRHAERADTARDPKIWVK